MEESNAIPRKRPTKDVLDHAYLKQLATDHLHQLCGKLWTDFNVHDPGVTLLEILCYAVTEAGFRARFPVVDLLEPPPKEKPPSDTLFPPTQILPSAPLTALDYNRLMLDIDGISIVRCRASTRDPDFKGIYEVEVQLGHGANRAEVRRQIHQLYHSNRLDGDAEENGLLKSNRNLCEDLGHIRFLEETPIRFHLHLRVEDRAEPGPLVRSLVAVLNSYLSAQVPFFHPDQLLETGHSLDELLTGPALRTGFVPEKALKELKLRTEIRTSDLYPMIGELEGIGEIKSIGMEDRFHIFHPWVCKVEHGRVPRLDLKGSRLELFNAEGTHLFSGNLEQDRASLSDLKHLRTKQRQGSFPAPRGEYIPMEGFETLQNEFPRKYGIGTTGLPASATGFERGRSKQLQGFLLFFEQRLGNFFADLGSLNRRFSIDAIDQTKYYQGLLDVPGAEFLYHPFLKRFIERHIDLENHFHLQAEWTEFKQGFLGWKRFLQEVGEPQSDGAALSAAWKQFEAGQVNKDYLDAVWEMDRALYAAVEGRKDFLTERNALLDHFLARFAVDAMEYHLNGTLDHSPLRQIQDKLAALNQLPATSKGRGTGMDISQPKIPVRHLPDGHQGTLNMAGLESHLLTRFRIAPKSLGGSKEGDFQVGLSNAFREKVPALEIEVFNTDTHGAVEGLFKWGTKASQLRATNNKRSFDLLDAEGKAIARLKLPAKLQLSDDAPSQIAAKIGEMGTRFENLHLVEHLLLRPRKVSSSFGLAIRSPRSGEILFESEATYTWKDRESVLWKLLTEGDKEGVLRTVKVTHKQFKVGMEIEGGTLLGPEFFLTQERAEEELQAYRSDIRRLFHEVISKGSDAEKLFRMSHPGQLQGATGGEQTMASLFEAGVEKGNYAIRPEENGLSLQVSHPGNGAIFKSLQRIDAPEKEERMALAHDFQAYCIGYLRNLILQNAYQHPQVEFRTSRHGFFSEIGDPFSHVMSVVLPAWPPRFQDPIFRSALEKVTFTHAPAHLVVNIRWLDYPAYQRFLQLYEALLAVRRAWMEERLAWEQAEDVGGKKVKGKGEDSLRAKALELSRLGDELLELLG